MLKVDELKEAFKNIGEMDRSKNSILMAYIKEEWRAKK